MARSFHTTDIGSGATVFCLHDATSSSQSFHALESLTDRFRIVAWDAPGYGQSDPVGQPRSLEWYAEYALAVLDQAGSDPAHLIGNGWGAAIALQMAAMAPERVKSLILVGGTVGLESDPGLADRAYGAEQEADFPRLRRELAERQIAKHAPGAARELVKSLLDETVSEEGYRSAVHSIRGTDVFTQSRSLHVPTLVLCGDADEMLGVDESQRVSSAVPNAVFVTMDHAGHLPQIDTPETFEAWVRSFLYIIDRIPGDADR